MSDAHPALDIPELATDFVFRERPFPIPGDLRPSWRVGLVVLLLRYCGRAKKSTIARLQVLNWGVRDNETSDALQSAIDGRAEPQMLIVRFDPFLIRAIAYAAAEGLVAYESGKSVRLLDEGSALAEELFAAEGAFVREKQFIARIGRSLTEAWVNTLFGWKT